VKNLGIILFLLFIWGCGNYKTQVVSLQQQVDGMRADSLLLERRIEKLKEENIYLSGKAATVEQAYIIRLQEKEDSLQIRVRQIADREREILEMQARREQERDAFRKLSVTIFDVYKAFNLGSDNIAMYTECSQMIVEMHDRVFFTPQTTKPDARMAIILKQTAELMGRHEDLMLQVVVLSDSVINTKEKIDDIWDWTSKKATIIGKQLKNDLGIPATRFTTGTQAIYQPQTKNKLQTNQRVVFIFRSNLLPCLQ
jgi:hypothetical protein